MRDADGDGGGSTGDESDGRIAPHLADFES